MNLPSSVINLPFLPADHPWATKRDTSPTGNDPWTATADPSMTAKNPARGEGTVYEIKRSIGTEPFVTLGVVGQRKYLDRDIPANSLADGDACGGRVLYEITAIRSTLRGTPSQHIVRFGTHRGNNAATAGPTARIARIAA